ncbi:MAG TPA: hypothetical protein VG895_02335 [Patescibacteria group bacterium]|nr:hypothetical protein [Patescibacteria group bacterium]
MGRIRQFISKINPKSRKYILLAIVVVIVLFLGIKVLTGKNAKPKIAGVNISAPQKAENLNKEFDFPIGNTASTSNGNPETVKFVIQNAALNNQIVIQGQEATAVTGRTFLIVTLALTNSFDQPISINTKDYVRLSANGDQNTWLAPTVDNDPVTVQAISTVYSRLGFTVNTSDKNFVLQVGEIKGDKQKIPLTL